VPTIWAGQQTDSRARYVPDQTGCHESRRSQADNAAGHPASEGRNRIFPAQSGEGQHHGHVAQTGLELTKAPHILRGPAPRAGLSPGRAARRVRADANYPIARL
jgi:hypothetical protein